MSEALANAFPACFLNLFDGAKPETIVRALANHNAASLQMISGHKSGRSVTHRLSADSGAPDPARTYPPYPPPYPPVSGRGVPTIGVD